MKKRIKVIIKKVLIFAINKINETEKLERKKKGLVIIFRQLEQTVRRLEDENRIKDDIIKGNEEMARQTQNYVKKLEAKVKRLGKKQ